MRKRGLELLRYAEPARLRAVWVALVALLAATGITVSTSVDARVGAVIGAVGGLLALAQGEVTRAAVYSPETHDAAVRAAVQAAQGGPAGPAGPDAGDGP